MAIKLFGTRRLGGSKEERKKAFLKNGGVLLEKLVAACDGKPIPIRSFSYEELRRATNNYDQRCVLQVNRWYTWYKGSVNGRIVSIKKYEEDLTFPNSFTDIAMAAKMSSHKNVLRLVGCCLETRLPTLVFEFSDNGFLSDRLYQCDIHGYPREHHPMSWQIRLKIAREIAHAIAYIHTAFSRPIIHRDIKPGNIFLDQHNVPKLADFSLTIQIPEGESHVEDEVFGSNGFLCPNYLATSRATEKTDVYSFGMLLLVLSTGQRSYIPQPTTHEDGLINYIRNCTISEMVDPAILAEEGGASVEQQLQAVRVLFLRCMDENPEMRPTMVDVTKQLRQIERFMP
jgi:serine/threonine protein kinase